MDYKAFFDLNIELSYEDDLWKTLCDYNIRTVAVNQILDATSNDDGKKKKGEKKEDLVPSPVDILIPEAVKLVQNLLEFKLTHHNDKEYNTKIVALKRLTISISDGNTLYKIIQSPNFKKYDIIALSPTNQATLQACCASNDIDLICFEAQSKPQWTVSRKLYKIAMQKNIFFELQYSPLISDSSSRKNTIQIAHHYHTMGKSKNIVISSGTGKVKLLRTPYDVINFCFLLGFNENKAKEALTSNAKQLLLQARNRRFNKSVLNVTIWNEDRTFNPEKNDKMEE